MTAAYFDDFEPLERFVAVHKPQDVQPLEARFNAIRGELGAGLKGEALAARWRGFAARSNPPSAGARRSRRGRSGRRSRPR